MRYAIHALVILLFFTSCKNDSKSSIAVYRMTIEGLEKSNKIIVDQISCHLKSLERKLWEVGEQELAEIWQPVSVKVHKLSNELIKYLDTLKSEVRNVDDADYNLVKRIFLIKKKGEYLFKKLKKYESDIVSIKPEMRERFMGSISLLSVDIEISDTQKFTDKYLKDIPAIAVVALLSNIENQVRKTEYDLVRLGDLFSTSISCDFSDDFSAIVSLSSTTVSPNEIIEVHAGIGYFSRAAQPKIMINGKDIDLSDEAVAIYGVKANSVPGEYKIPVNIEYTKPDGQKQIYSRFISYNVEK